MLRGSESKVEGKYGRIKIPHCFVLFCPSMSSLTADVILYRASTIKWTKAFQSKGESEYHERMFH